MAVAGRTWREGLVGFGVGQSSPHLGIHQWLFGEIVRVYALVWS
jgi:hypothetical protein